MARQVAELPAFARNVAVKLLCAARLERLAVVLGHRAGDGVYCAETFAIGHASEEAGDGEYGRDVGPWTGGGSGLELGSRARAWRRDRRPELLGRRPPEPGPCHLRPCTDPDLGESARRSRATARSHGNDRPRRPGAVRSGRFCGGDGGLGRGRVRWRRAPRHGQRRRRPSAGRNVVRRRAVHAHADRRRPYRARARDRVPPVGAADITSTGR